VARLVYTSSIVTVGYSSSPDVILDEATNQRTDATTYHSAKWLAEREVLSFAATHGLPVVVVNPATIVGSLDYRVTPSNAVIQRCLDQGLRLAVPGGVTVTHAEDVARGLFLAMQRGRPGERYILGGDRVVLREYFSLIADECGRPRPVVDVAAGRGHRKRSMLQHSGAIERPPDAFFVYTGPPAGREVRLVFERQGRS
jgi:dihydroflavonol-4-reductase